MASDKITVVGLENFMQSQGKSLFTKLVLPDEVDRDTCINSCILRANEFEVLYPDGDFFAEMVGLWSSRYQLTFNKWVEGFAAEFSPIDNYDRQEEWEDHSGSEDKTKYGKKEITDFGHSEDTTYGKSSDTTYGKTDTLQPGKIDTHEVSAFDSGTYQPKDRNTESGTTTDTLSGVDSVVLSGSDTLHWSGKDTVELSGTDTVTGKNNSSHKGRVHGNIGVMTTTDILAGWTDFYKDHNIYDLIAELFVTQFCIMVY